MSDCLADCLPLRLKRDDQITGITLKMPACGPKSKKGVRSRGATWLFPLLVASFILKGNKHCTEKFKLLARGRLRDVYIFVILYVW